MMFVYSFLDISKAWLRQDLQDLNLWIWNEEIENHRQIRAKRPFQKTKGLSYQPNPLK